MGVVRVWRWDSGRDGSWVRAGGGSGGDKGVGDTDGGSVVAVKCGCVGELVRDVTESVN